MSDNRSIPKDSFQQHPNFFYSVSAKSENILQAATAKSQESFGLNIFHAATGKSEIVPSLTGQTVSILESFRLQNS